MAKRIESAVFDTGIFIHLDEINLLSVLTLFKQITVPEIVLEELKPFKVFSAVKKSKNVKTLPLNARQKDLTSLLTDKYGLHMGEAAALSFCLVGKSSIFFTDDLEARNIAKSKDIEVHGTIGIILRAFREKILSKVQAKKSIQLLYSDSSLFLTRGLMLHVLKQIDEF